MGRVGRLLVGCTLAEDLRPLCCDHVIPAGARILVRAGHSQKRVIVQVGNHPNTPRTMVDSLHKVKASAVRFA